MADRVALVIGSESTKFGLLGCTGELATALYTTLTTEGCWRPLGDGPVLDPTVAEFHRIVKAAFRQADALRATLLIAFIGHGFTDDDDFYLLARDSELPLDFDTGLSLVHVVATLLKQTKSLDGLIVLVDACEAATGVTGAGDRWVKLMEKSSGRMELLVASDQGNAYDGCFTRTMLRTFDSGLGARGTNLLCGDLYPEINAACEWQNPRHLTFNGARVQRGDLGLWLVPNRARRRDAVTGRPVAGLVDHLLYSVSPTMTVQEILAAMVESGGDRLQALVGPAGSGKSTIMALLVRPALIPALGGVTPEFVSAAVFLDLTSSVETMIAELTAQLDTRFGGEFRSARAAVLAEVTDHDRVTEFEIAVVRPLQRLRAPGRRIRLLVDGLDQPEEAGRDGIVTAVATLSTDERLPHVRVIVGIRSGTEVENRPELAHARVFALRPPSLAEVLAGFVAVDSVLPAALASAMAGLTEDTTGGGWLIPRLVTEIDWTLDPDQTMDLIGLVEHRFHTTARRPGYAAVCGPLVTLLAAVGVGPVAPLRLVADALGALGTATPLTHLHDLVVDLGILVARGNPGQRNEKVGLAHLAFTAPLTAAVGGAEAVRAAHAVLADLLAPAAGQESAPEQDIAAYALAAAPRHLLASGNPARALEFLDRLDARRRPIDNRASWAGWLAAFEEALPPDNTYRLAARSRLARWTGDAGDPHGARDLYAELAGYCTRVFGPEHQETIAAQLQLAHWIGELGYPDQAVAIMTELLPSQLAITEPEHPDTLRIRADLGFWTGQTGDITGARDQYTQFLPVLERVLGPTHVDVLRSRDQYARWVGEDGDPDTALQILTEAVPVFVQVLGPEHSDTLWAKLNLAWWMGSCGNLSGAIELNTEVALDRERISGPEHPATLVTKANLAYWLAMGGKYKTALDVAAPLLEIRLRLYDSDNYETLLLEENLADYTGRAGDPTGARERYTELLAKLEQSPRADPSLTAKVRTALAFWKETATDG
ncbi:tetratricopeptide repeat protein [Nocardia lijiangensis]|uniref:tetratricopeptide repeat protein n=1 Tax=Nocardia lijiangensis TaxID=299618 RepID=UPI00082FFE94|nr:tetratricopeptide repeat protein [Nocardia lijiangensis]